MKGISLSRHHRNRRSFPLLHLLPQYLNDRMNILIPHSSSPPLIHNNPRSSSIPILSNSVAIMKDSLYPKNMVKYPVTMKY